MADTTVKRFRSSPSGPVRRRRKSVSNARQGEQRSAIRSLHFSFAFKIGLAMSLIAICGAMVLVYLAVNQHWRLSQEQSNAFGQTIAEQLAASIVEPVFTDDRLAIQLNLNQLASKKVVISAAVYQADGLLLAMSHSAASGQSAVEQLSATLPSRSFAEILQSLPSGYYQAPVIFSGVTAAYTIVSIDQSPLSAAFATSIQDLIVAVIVISLLSVLGAYVLSRMLSQPIYRLLSISEDARQGRLHTQPSRLKKKRLSKEWADIFSIYEQLGHEVKHKREVEKLLQQFVATDVAEQLLNQEDRLSLQGESVEATVLFVDIVDFTRIAEPMAPDDVAHMLNRYLSIFASCARIYKGNVDKFIGDAAMIVFGAPRKDDNHRLHAMACALAIQLAAHEINLKRAAIDLKPIQLRVGINSGMMRAGILGSEYRKEFTVVGDAVNLASRLCNHAAPEDILISESVYNASRDLVKVAEAGTINVKGMQKEIAIYQLLSANMPQNWVVTNLIEDIVAQS